MKPIQHRKPAAVLSTSKPVNGRPSGCDVLLTIHDR
jgi:hypothetical protein